MTRMIAYLKDSLSKRVPGNIELKGREKIPVPGGHATVRSIGVNMDGSEVLIPTAYDGKVHSDSEAIQRHKDTGKHLGKFSTPYQATRYAKRLSKDQAKQ